MKKVYWIALILLIALPAHAKIVSRSVEYQHGDVVLQGYLAHDDSKAGNLWRI